MENIFKKQPDDPRGVKKTFDGVEITTDEKITVADAIRLKADGYEFKDVKKGRRGLKKYIFNKK